MSLSEKSGNLKFKAIYRFVLMGICAFLLGSAAMGADEVAPRMIVADYGKVVGVNNHFERVCVGAGRAHELLRKSAVDHLKDVRENCGFQYIRFHGLFHDDMAVYSERNGKEAYNFQYVDQAYDAIIDTGMKPFVEFSFMPRSMASGNQTVFWWGANVTPPKDPEKWSRLITAFTKHMEERYGRDEVKTWYFEVWNEPNHPAFFSAKQPEYFQLYDVTVKAVKGVCADYRVGGPASAGNAWVPDLIKHCKENNVPLDFIATHTYGVKSLLDESGKKDNYLVEGDDVIASGVRRVHKQITDSSMPKLPLHYTEWSLSSSSRDACHDSYISASYIVNTIKHATGHADSMSYWTYTDIFEESGPPPTPFHGGFGLINTQGLRKPSFYAYHFMNQLGKEVLDCSDAKATVCKSEDGVQALVWNYTYLKQDAPNNIFFKRDLPAKPLPPTTLALKGIPPGQYQLQVYGVGYRRNDVYADFMDMGSPANPTREQTRVLASKNSGLPMADKTIIIQPGETFIYPLDLRENDVFLVKLKKTK